MREEANETKQEKMLYKHKMEEQKRFEEAKAQNMKNMIRHQQHEAMSKRQIDFIDKQNRAKAQIEEKLQREAYEQTLYEQEVSRMEREELELINRLKNTKLLEEAAHHELENAINDPNPNPNKQQQQQQQQPQRN